MLMKKIILILIASLIFISCYKEKYEESQKTVDSLITVNKNLLIEKQNQETDIQKLSEQVRIFEKRELNRNRTKYVWTAIYHKRGTYTSYSSTGKTGFLANDLSNHIYYSDVKTISEFSDAKKFKLQDQLESEMRGYFGNSIHSIQSRKTYVFDTYQEASSHRYITIN